MINLRADTSEHMACDQMVVEFLVRAATNAMEHAAIPDITTPSEILSAAFTILSRTLLAMRKLQAPEDRAYNTLKIRRVLETFLIDFGSTIN